jgi:acetyl-CoA carboxylase biotin carboxyl carrier protein
MATGGKKSAGKLTRVKKALAKKSSKKESRSAAPAAPVSKNGKRSSGSEMDLDFQRGLIDAVDKSGIDSVEIDREGTKVRISKTPPAAPAAPVQMAAPMMHAPVMQQGTAAAPSVSAASAPSAPAAAAPEAPKSNYIDIKSPMVGTFYRAPAPEAPSYAELGSHVTKGQTLCILEAMKLMNELESEVDGIVREILVDNADPVEYGQVLFRIEPAR